MDIKEMAGALHALAEALSRASQPPPAINFKELSDDQRQALELVFNSWLELKIGDMQKKLSGVLELTSGLEDIDLSEISNFDDRIADVERSVEKLDGVDDKLSDIESKLEDLEDLDAERINDHISNWDDLEVSEVKDAVSFYSDISDYGQELKAILDMVRKLRSTSVRSAA
jgi:hypothetical protein